MVKIYIPDNFVLIVAPTLDQRRQIIIDQIRSGTASQRFIEDLADMLDPSARTPFRLVLQRRASGKPNQKVNEKLLLKIMDVLESFDADEKVSAAKVLDRAEKLNINLNITKKQIDEKTIRRYFKIIEEISESHKELDARQAADEGKQLPE
jgi:hypothetical protein